MAFIRWDPFRDFLSMQDRMNRLFDETLSKSRKTGDEVSRGVWYPAVDIYETDEEIILKAELPGIDRKDVDLEVKDNIMILSGERRFNKDVKEENYHRMERSYGSFHRLFTLPNVIDKARVKAQFNYGVLEVILPKAKEVKPKHIKVEML